MQKALGPSVIVHKSRYPVSNEDVQLSSNVKQITHTVETDKSSQLATPLPKRPNSFKGARGPSLTDRPHFFPSDEIGSTTSKGMRVASTNENFRNTVEELNASDPRVNTSSTEEAVRRVLGIDIPPTHSLNQRANKDLSVLPPTPPRPDGAVHLWGSTTTNENNFESDQRMQWERHVIQKGEGPTTLLRRIQSLIDDNRSSIASITAVEKSLHLARSSAADGSGKTTVTAPQVTTPSRPAAPHVNVLSDGPAVPVRPVTSLSTHLNMSALASLPEARSTEQQSISSSKSASEHSNASTHYATMDLPEISDGSILGRDEDSSSILTYADIDHNAEPMGALSMNIPGTMDVKPKASLPSTSRNLPDPPTDSKLTSSTTNAVMSKAISTPGNKQTHVKQRRVFEIPKPSGKSELEQLQELLLKRKKKIYDSTSHNDSSSSDKSLDPDTAPASETLTSSLQSAPVHNEPAAREMERSTGGETKEERNARILREMTSWKS